MTLINYLTRVHFADGVLEEAVRSEMELNAKRRPLIIAEEADLAGPAAERFLSSFPIRSRPEIFSAVPHRANESGARQIAETYHDRDCDLLIALGSTRAMDLAKVARIAIAYDEPIVALSSEEGGRQRISDALPDLYSIPGVLGFASAITDYTRVGLDKGGQVLLSSPHLIPTVAICDPTLTLGADRGDTACAAVGTLARGIDAYFASAYNPPADGLALDAISRAVSNMERAIFDDDLPARREMMASGLNSSLALQKGLCAIHAIANAVASVIPTAVEPTALGTILIPELSRRYAVQAPARTRLVKRSLGLTEDEPLGNGIERLISGLPVARTLAELGVPADVLPRAAGIAARDRAVGNGPAPLSADDILGILSAVHGAAPSVHATSA